MPDARSPHSRRWFWEYGWLGPGIASDGADDPLFAAAEELASLRRARRAAAQVREDFPFTACGFVGHRARRLLDEALS